MEEYVPNSHKYKEEQKDGSEKRIDKVITGTAKTKKRNEIRKLADVFISEDANNVKSYILLEVLVPAVKKAISDIVTNGIDMILYGETGRSKRNSNGSKVSYRNYYEERNEKRPSGAVSRHSVYDYDDIILDSRGEAEEVLSSMDEIISKYGLISVGDLYDLVGIQGNYTDQKYGWTDIRNASVIRVRDGYILKLPKALPFN